MLLQQATPQGLKCAATTIHGIQFGEIGMLTAVVTPLDPMGRDAGVTLFYCLHF
jgi:hypothetical protein